MAIVRAGSRRRQRPRAWWGEVVLVAVFDFVYETTSNITAGDRAGAVRDGLSEVRLERSLGVFFEARLQHALLGDRLLLQACDLFYTTVHFVLPVFALLWLYFKFPERYVRARNTLAWTTAIALVVFIAFPVAPPRLLPQRLHFVDTVATYGGGSPFFGFLMKSAGNQYAAMPSLHLAWSAWCALSLAPVLRRRWLKVLVWLDPFLTSFVVIVTANHLLVDLVAGAAVLAIGSQLARRDWVMPLVARLTGGRWSGRWRSGAGGQLRQSLPDATGAAPGAGAGTSAGHGGATSATALAPTARALPQERPE